MGIFSIFKKAKSNEIEEDINSKEIINNKIIEKDKDFVYDFKVEDIKVDNKGNEVQIVNLGEEELDRVIIDQIIRVIDNHKDFTTIQDIAKNAITNIGTNNIGKLKEYISGRVSKPSSMKGRYEGLGEWPMVVENSVLSIIYNFEELGVDELLKISLINNSTRLKAMNLLCKLASRGIDREKIVDSIIYIMKPLKEGEVLQVLSFLSQIKNHPKVERLLNLYYKKYIYENKYENAYETVLSIINFKGKCTVEQLTFLKAISLHEGELDISLVIKGEAGKINIKDITNNLKINAAVSFYSLNKSDQEINNMLSYLMDNSLDMELRKYLRDIINIK